MADPPFDFDPTNPADNALISQYPANERTSRDNTQDSFAVEHTEAGGRHMIGVGNDAARDAITDWVIGSFWLNTVTTPAALERVVSIGPVVWEIITQISPVTTEGDLIVANASGAEVRLAIGAAAKYLRADGTTAAWSALLSADLPAASESVAGVAEIATDAEVLAATDDARIVTPAKMSKHPGVAAGFVKFSNAGVIDKSFNVSSVDDLGTGTWRVNWATAFADANYVLHGGTLLSATTNTVVVFNTQLVGSVIVNTINATLGTVSEINLTAVFITALGD